MTAQQIRQRLEMILSYMQPYWEFVNCHMVNFLTHNHWERFIPTEMQYEIESSEHAKLCIENMLRRQCNTNGTTKKAFPLLDDFVSSCREHTLEHFDEILKSTAKLKKEIELRETEKTSISIKEFLTDKKRHEVEIMAKLVDDLINSQFSKDEINENVYIVDAGDGKGYLSSRLSLEYGYKVLGIDANETNTENALERNRKLERAWNGLVQRADLIQSGITPPRRGKKATKLSTAPTFPIEANSNYRTTAQFIDTNLCLTDLVLQHFTTEKDNFKPFTILTGLHTCGNLAPTCLRVFHAETKCRIVCNIGCCYHFLKEEYTTSKWEHSTPIINSTNDFGFPMSNYLRESEIKLGRNARMLAAQSVERILAMNELPNISLFYRALLEVIIYRQNPECYDMNETIQVGRLRKFTSFKEYLDQCVKKLKLPVLTQLTALFIDDLEMEFAEKKNFLDLFYLIRMHFAPIIESLILLDRLLYLKELGYERSYLVSAFDAIISPRHYAVIALRN